MSGQPLILYLDQNAWIELSRAVKDPDGNPQIYAVLEQLVSFAKSGQILVPLSFTNIYETHKINELERRKHLAWVQCSLSQGRVFRGRSVLLRQQIADFLSQSFELPPPSRMRQWFLSDLHFEAVGDYDPVTFGVRISDTLIESMRENPAFTLFHYLTELPEETRRAAVQKFSNSSCALMKRLEERRAQIRTEPQAMRKRIYSVQLLIDHASLILEVGKELGCPFSTVGELGSSRTRALMEAVPTLTVERDIAVKVEGEDRVIEENDLRDISSFYTVLPYADIVVAEKAFINRARQAGLGKRCSTELLTALPELPEALARKTPKAR